MFELGSGEIESDLVRFNSLTPLSYLELSFPRILILFLTAHRNDCEGSESGSLDVDAFVKAMWRIDEELRKARLNPSPNSGYGSLSRRQPRIIGSILR